MGRPTSISYTRKKYPDTSNAVTAASGFSSIRTYFSRERDVIVLGLSTGDTLRVSIETKYIISGSLHFCIMFLFESGSAAENRSRVVMQLD